MSSVDSLTAAVFWLNDRLGKWADVYVFVAGAVNGNVFSAAGPLQTLGVSEEDGGREQNGVSLYEYTLGEDNSFELSSELREFELDDTWLHVRLDEHTWLRISVLGEGDTDDVGWPRAASRSGRPRATKEGSAT